MRHCMSLIGVNRDEYWFLVELVRGVGLVFGVLAVNSWHQIFFYDPDGNVIEVHHVDQNLRRHLTAESRN